jgi:hypothetical protein
MAKERNLDMFWLLGEMDRHNFDVWDTLNEEQRKEVSPFMLLRWMMGTGDPEQLVMLGEVANLCLFEFGDKKKDLLLKVLTACSVNGPKRYSWKNFKGGTQTVPKAIQLIQACYGYTAKQAQDARKLFAAEDIMALAESRGWQKDELKDLQKELA